MPKKYRKFLSSEPYLFTREAFLYLLCYMASPTSLSSLKNLEVLSDQKRLILFYYRIDENPAAAAVTVIARIIIAIQKAALFGESSSGKPSKVKRKREVLSLGSFSMMS